MCHIILCYSRSYLSHLLPELSRAGDDLVFLHIAQNKAERAVIEGKGGRVVLVIETAIREGLVRRDCPTWHEPEDFRSVTGFDWDTIYSDRHLPEFRPELRGRVAGLLFAAFARLFADHRIVGVLSEPVAVFPTHVLQYLIKRKGGACLFWANAYFPGHFYFSDHVTIDRPLRLIPMPDAERDDMETAVRAYVERVAQDAAGPVYHHRFAERKARKLDYFEQRKGQNALIYEPGLPTIAVLAARLGRACLARLLFPRRFDYMAAASVGEHLSLLRNLLGRRRRYDAPPDGYAQGNVFYPLQYEPEASLLYAAPDVRNQLALIESMAQALPAGHLLWVKEHPNQFGALTAPAWQRLRRRYHNLRFIYGRENGRELIRACGLAVSITSTAGMDALIFGRRTIVLGNVFYREFPGAIALSSVADLAAALNDPNNYVVGDFKAGIIDKMIEFGRACYPGDPQPATGLYAAKNVANLYRAIHEHTVASLAPRFDT